jgi:uncharacterized protein YdhG (YjbR/CyaY superfamily)
MKSESSKPSDMDAYIANFPSDVADRLESIRRTIREAVPDAEEAIKYGIPTFVRNGNMISFAAYANHIGVYPVPNVPEFADAVERWGAGKGTLRFPLDEPVPLDVVRGLVEYRAAALVVRARRQVNARTA